MPIFFPGWSFLAAPKKPQKHPPKKPRNPFPPRKK